MGCQLSIHISSITRCILLSLAKLGDGQVVRFLGHSVWFYFTLEIDNKSIGCRVTLISFQLDLKIGIFMWQSLTYIRSNQDRSCIQLTKQNNVSFPGKASYSNAAAVCSQHAVSAMNQLVTFQIHRHRILNKNDEVQRYRLAVKKAKTEFLIQISW